MTTIQPPQSHVTDRYLEHFKPAEFRFRWTDASGLDDTLPRRANHLAARLNTLYFQGHTTTTSYAELCQITRMSQKSLERAIPELERSGWISCSKERGMLIITLQLGDRGLDLLLDERERRQTFRGRREINEQWATFVFDSVVNYIGLNPAQVRGIGKWRTLYSKIRSMVSHMHFPESEAIKLRDELTESLPSSIQDPAGFFLSRAADYIKRRPYLNARQHQSNSYTSSSSLNETIADLTSKLSMNHDHLGQ